MKKDKSCKSRKGESTIGKIIYGFLLFAPLIAMLTTCMYVIFNKNAYQSYTGSYKYEKTETITDITELENSKIYIGTINSQNTFIAGNLNYLKFENENYQFSTDNYNYSYYTITMTTAGIFNIYGYNSQGQQSQSLFRNPNVQIYNNVKLQSNNIESLNNNQKTLFLTNFQPKIQTFFVDKTLSNVFYASTETLKNNDLFNWTTNTLIYTGVQATTSTLGITNTFIPMLLAYWLIISILYFIYDIVLMIILILHDKIHELQESI